MRINKWIVFGLIIAAAVAPYLNIFPNEFAYDDGDFFLGWSGIKKVDIGSFFAGNLPMYHRHVYRPIRSIIQSIVYQFSSTNPFGYHVFALVVHLLSVFLVYLIAKKISNKIVALVAAMIFALLPVHTMSIAFMTASFDIAGIVFLLIAFYLYLLFRESAKKKHFYGSILLGLVAFFTYELTLILPLLIILYDFCFKKITKEQIKYYVSYFSGALLFLIIRFSVLKEIYREQFLTEIDFFSRMLTMSKAFIRYIYLTIVNFPLSVYYDTEISYSLADIKAVGSILIISGLIGLAIFFYKRNFKIYTFIIGWFFISLLPVSNIIPIAFFVSEQYLYLASFAWVLLIGSLFGKFYQKKKLIVLLLIILVLAYGSLTWQRNKVWQNDAVLWQNVLAKQPDSVKAYNNLAFYYRNQEDYQTAQKYLKKALEIKPEYSLAYVNLGEICIEQEHFKEAVKYFEKAIALRPNYAASYYNLGFCYYNLGQLEKAEENYQKAIKIYPRYYQSNKNLAVLYLNQKRYDEAIKKFQDALGIQKDDYELYFGLGLSYLAKNQKETAEEYFQKALKINPDFESAQEYLNQLRN